MRHNITLFNFSLSSILILIKMEKKILTILMILGQIGMSFLCPRQFNNVDIKNIQANGSEKEKAFHKVMMEHHINTKSFFLMITLCNTVSTAIILLIEFEGTSSWNCSMGVKFSKPENGTINLKAY